MSILIKGMEMPQSCWDCEFEAPTIDHHECCILTKKSYNWGLTTRPSDCPLVPVPPHGDLIDRDALKEAFCGNCFADEKPMECSEPCMDMKIILDAPTIIPADVTDTNDGNILTEEGE